LFKEAFLIFIIELLMNIKIATWGVFIGLIILLLVFDLVVLHKKGQAISNKKAAKESLFWISLAGLFSLAIFYLFESQLVTNPNNLTPQDAVVKYITGYLIELSLSVDNLFVIAMIFASFKIPLQFQHRVLFWGILGAIIFRAIMIFAGVLLINKISWITYIFGAFLLFTAFKMLTKKEHSDQASGFKKFLYKRFKVSNSLDGERFWIREKGVKMATPLFIALLMIELTDVLFAVDSIPAILAVTTDPFIVFSSNIFAVLGLRSLYFFLANMLERFKYLKYSVFAILIFVSLKLLTLHFYKLPEWFSLCFIGLSLLCGILVSLQVNPKEKDPV
jgi:tellurite resistance protein TerC